MCRSRHGGVGGPNKAVNGHRQRAEAEPVCGTSGLDASVCYQNIGSILWQMCLIHELSPLPPPPLP